MDAAIVLFFQIDALDFRGKSGKFVKAFFKGLEILNSRLRPAFARYDAEDARRIRQGAFQGDAALDIVESNQFALAADEGVMSFLGLMTYSGKYSLRNSFFCKSLT